MHHPQPTFAIAEAPGDPRPACLAGSSDHRRAAGLSLLELLITLALMALVVAIAVPMLGSGVSTTQLRAAARELAAGLRLARSEAVAGRADTLLSIDLARRSFRVASHREDHALPSGVELKLFTAQRDLVSATAGAIRFFPDGGSTGGRVTVASGERKFDIDVDWLTGRVSISD